MRRAIQPFRDAVSKEAATRVAVRCAWLEYAHGTAADAASANQAVRAAIDALEPTNPMRMTQTLPPQKATA
ncbi:MAG: hypothetical protein WA864_00945 [Acetobacteraceae bacterium]|jgi:hypothetical protein